MEIAKEYLRANDEEMLVVFSLNKNNDLNQPKVLRCLNEDVDKRLLQQGLNFWQMALCTSNKRHKITANKK